MANIREPGGLESIRNKSVSTPMWELFTCCLKYGRHLWGGIFMAIISRASRLVPPLIVAAAIDRVISAPGEPGLLALFGLLPSDVIPAENMEMRSALLVQLVWVALLAYLVRAVTRFLSRYWLQSMAQKVQRDLRNRTYDHMQSLPMSFFDDHESGGMMSILNNDVNRLEEFLNMELTQVIRVATIVVGIAGVMLYVYPKMAIIALIPVPIIGFASGGFLIWIDKRYRAIRETVSRINSRLANNLGGMKVIKAFNRHDHESERVSDQSEQYHDQHVSAIKIRRAYFSFLRLTTGFAFVAILYLGGHDVMAGNITIGTFTLFFLLLRRLYGPMRRIGRTANKFQLAKSSAERVFGLLGTEPTIRSPRDAHRPPDIKGQVDFENVSFRYPSGERILHGISLEVEPGETIGLVGPTGAGKSTMLKLIPRFYDVEKGVVCVDGVDVRNYDLRALRAPVAVVDQDPFLFSGTVMENIAYGSDRLFRRVMDEEEVGEDVLEPIRTAATAAEADEFIQNLPDRFHTQIGERGVKLSGGQCQRLAIARALLNDPRIILLDEATSDVDTGTEILIQRSIERLCEDRTAFIIAHRLSTVQKADRIVVLKDGRIHEVGPHEQLLKSDGLYQDLWQAQGDDREVGRREEVQKEKR